MTPTSVSSGRKYSRIIRPIILSTDSRHAAASLSATKISRTSRQSARRGVRSLRRAPSSTDSQWLPAEAGVQVEAHRQEPVLAGELQGLRALADAGDTDWRIRLLQRSDVWPQGAQHQIGLGHFPIFAGIVERFLRGPPLEDDVERLARHLAVLPGIAVDVEHRPVARQPA